MVVTLVHVNVKKEFVDVFIAETGRNHYESIKEPGNLRFDILQDSNDPCRFTLYEAYVSDEASAAHKETPHYKIWRAAVEPWMAEPRKGVKHRVIFPKASQEW